MKVTTERHLAAFEKEVRYWIGRFGLTDWEVSFKREKLDGIRAQVSTNYIDRSASFFLCTEWSEPMLPLTLKSVRHSGKHEAIELLVSDLATMANSRYISEDESQHARHSLVQRLMAAL